MYKFIYICQNRVTSEAYAGKHETDNIGDDYLGSSGSTEFLHDYYSGLIKKPHKIFFHNDSKTILACEHFLILSLKNAKWKLYNKNAGGGGKGKIDLALVPDEFREIVKSIIETGVIPDNQYVSEEEKIAKKVLKDFLSGKYARVYEDMDVINSYEQWQPRAVLLNPKHVAKHQAEMKKDLSEYFLKTKPLVIIDDDRDGKQHKVEGNHRTAAANNLDLQKFPTSHILFSEFSYNWMAVTLFCNKLNKPNEIQQDLTPEDLRMQIAKLSEEKSHLDINGFSFEHEVYALFSEDYSNQVISSNLRIFRENILENKKKSERNFYIPNKKDLEETQKEILIDRDFKDACTISIASDAIMHSGVGAALHKLSENANKKQVVVVTRHASTDDEDKENDYLSHFEGTLKEAGFIKIKEKVFVNLNTNKFVKLFLLPCRVENTKIGVRYWDSYKTAFDAIR